MWLLFFLTVNITRHPEDKSVTTRANINFHVEAIGYDILQFQWQKDDKDIDINEPRFSSEETNGASTLHIQRVKKRDEGYYRCIVKNKNASEESGKPSFEAELRVCKSVVFYIVLAGDLLSMFLFFLKGNSLHITQNPENQLVTGAYSGKPSYEAVCK